MPSLSISSSNELGHSGTCAESACLVLFDSHAAFIELAATLVLVQLYLAFWCSPFVSIYILLCGVGPAELKGFETTAFQILWYTL